MPNASELLVGKRVLVLEDEVLVSISIENWLAELGCEIAGVAVQLDEAFEVIRSSALDLAVLDVNIGGHSSDPVASELIRRGIPFIVATGYAAGAFPESLQHVPMVQKPFDRTGLAAALQAALRPAAS